MVNQKISLTLEIRCASNLSDPTFVYTNISHLNIGFETWMQHVKAASSQQDGKVVKPCQILPQLLWFAVAVWSHYIRGVPGVSGAPGSVTLAPIHRGDNTNKSLIFFLLEKLYQKKQGDVFKGVLDAVTWTGPIISDGGLCCHQPSLGGPSSSSACPVAALLLRLYHISHFMGWECWVGAVGGEDWWAEGGHRLATLGLSSPCVGTWCAAAGLVWVDPAC